jgi:hypothetical protein
VVAATGTRTRLRYLGHLRRLGNADQVADHWLDGGDIRLAPPSDPVWKRLRCWRGSPALLLRICRWGWHG